ncbi:MAG: hypothetical protein ACD_66C00216G0002 [uncultured bacterium]|uniref:Bacterial spore germination immunoglobulin-like domain-containing protein n=1 Tax=Candidatus Uhrbacteria bacterium GW2011_GWC1_41_20 TaxID=1618983 RepID=A0A0G0VJD7_9BACT|nr:MAG: hypothetical protein ACD_66C00216G0002 [uncultured bacterium]KKR23037.1 MAG: hypothetical protein UT52_C0003G0016 [Candidatus Uhrbacteria bacterium GW2011_GWE1_39_46]KKR64276.1 MAG: hypothetical protein UU04_C0003G0016 [Candidatus Uhrbacteria bacterium GW2011_GWC2_40_450]KKR89889.1 MAG: hypothetical protein UU36_C0015G0004 [Candidatus Uhrbacteria bacterium GW2011_GWE2_41_1153]KKR90446.1 MAG: hypothetical protein UU40_C0003G0016 [Candidatus Uhrbacteria bacterium GW2011_GWD2_41_121]KKR96
MKKNILLVFALIIIIIACGLIYTQESTSDLTDENNYEQSYTNTTADEIIVDFEPGSTITSPLTITGQARGTWFFEATAPFVLVDWDGLIIAQGYIQTQGDWMTEEFVPFIGTLEFVKPSYGNTGALILQASNPSDLPEYDRAVEIPVKF